MILRLENEKMRELKLTDPSISTCMLSLHGMQILEGCKTTELYHCHPENVSC